MLLIVVTLILGSPECLASERCARGADSASTGTPASNGLHRRAQHWRRGTGGTASGPVEARNRPCRQADASRPQHNECCVAYLSLFAHPPARPTLTTVAVGGFGCRRARSTASISRRMCAAVAWATGVLEPNRAGISPASSLRRSKRAVTESFADRGMLGIVDGQQRVRRSDFRQCTTPCGCSCTISSRDPATAPTSLNTAMIDAARSGEPRPPQPFNVKQSERLRQGALPLSTHSFSASRLSSRAHRAAPGVASASFGYSIAGTRHRHPS